MMWSLLLTATVLLSASLGEQNQQPHLSYPNDQFVFGENAAKVNCSGRNRIICKENKLFIEIPATAEEDDDGNNQCSFLFRSPFQCPHPYAVQVIEDNPQKCHQNLQNCFLHQRVYYTRDGVLEVNLDNRKTFATTLPDSKLLLHVLRLECEKSLIRGNVTQESYTTTADQQPFTSRLRVIINGDSGLINMETTTPMEDTEDDFPENKVNYGNHFLSPQPPTNYFPPQPPPVLPPLAVENYLIPQPPRTSNVFLISPGFPRNPSGNGDCSFVIPRVDMYSCRLRINFKFFNLPDPDERHCHYHYLLIDNRRICGCRSGLIFLTQWDYQPKVVRYVNKRLRPSHQNVGFLLEIIQEQCPNRYESIQRRSGNGQEQREIEPVTNGFFQTSRTARFFHNQQCRFHFYDWLAVLGSPLWASRQQCRATFPVLGAPPQLYW